MEPLKICHCCDKFISPSRHYVISCSSCDSFVHGNCATDYVCKDCTLSLNSPLSSPHFNLFDPGEIDDYQMFDHDFEIDSHIDTLTSSCSILEKCDYIDPLNFQSEFSLELDSNSFVSFYFLNINGFKTNFDEYVLNHISVSNLFDIICFSETNVDSDCIAQYGLGSDYHCLDIPKLPDKQKGSGLALYYRKTLQLTLIDSLCNYGTSSRFQILGGKVKTECGFLHFLVVYRFHSCPVTEFCAELDTILNSITGPCVVLGDFNVNCFAYSLINELSDEGHTNSNSDTLVYVNSFLGKGFSPMISKGTRFDNRCNNTVTCIDQIWYNMLSGSIRSGVFNSSVSDHLPIFALLPVTVSSVSSPEPTNTSNKKYKITPVTLDVFANSIGTALSDTREFLKTHSPSENFSFFHQALHKVHDECIVDPKSKFCSRCMSDHPWITVALARSSKVKNILYKRWARSKGKDYESSRRDEYRTYRSKLRDLIRASKINYYKDLFEKSNGNARKTWGVINKIRCKMKGSSSPVYIEFNQQLITDRRAICSLFNTYFTDIANKLNNQKYCDSPPPPNDFRRFLGSRSCNSIFLYEIEPDEIIKIISGFNNNKSSDLCVRAIKHARHEIAPVLTQLFNDCMYSGIFPDELKIAKVIPLFKSGKRHDLSNYRPISILPLFSKIFEKLIHVRLTSFFDTNNVLSENQFGFRRKHSTVHALNTAISSITKSMNDKSYSIGIFIDFSKAFDTIKHDILLSKLEHYGIRGPALDLLTDYLTNRFQYVTLDGVCSDLLPISIGVPQGSVLGPLLFILYINDICNCASEAMFVLFADDTNVFISGSSILEAQQIAERTLLMISKYLFANYLHINVKKTKYIVFCSCGKNPPPCKIALDSSTLTRVRSIKFLGVILDERLSWIHQTDSLICKLSKTSGVLRTLSYSLPKSLRASVLSALVNSHISYGITVWGGNPTNMEKVFTAQKKCVRALYKIKRRCKIKGQYVYGHTKHIFEENSFLTAHNLYNYSMILDAYKVISSQYPVSYYKACYNISSLNSSRLLTTSCRLSSLASNFSYMIPLLWNNFKNVNNITNFSLTGFKSFKKSLKGFLLCMQSSFGSSVWHRFNNSLVDYCKYLSLQCLELTTNRPCVNH